MRSPRFRFISNLSRLGNGGWDPGNTADVREGLRTARKIVSRLTCSVEGRFFTLLRGELSEVILLCFNTV